MPEDKTPRFAKEVKIKRQWSPTANRTAEIHGADRGSLTTLEIDGEVFPWYLLDAPYAKAPGHSQLGSLVIEIPAECIVFEDPPPPPRDPIEVIDVPIED